LRIIAGTLKGRRLEAPDWPGLRPTSDKLRETLFNTLASRMDGARFLDGFAGTGAVGIEAVSRGAAHVTFVERDARAVRLIEKNIARAGVSADRHVIIRAELTGGIRRLAGQRFDIVFLDPPYGAADLHDALTAVEPLIGTETLLVIEHAKRDAAPAERGSLVRAREIVSGDSALAFYRVAEAS
jgi:16S rRNA (guanine(966)-N(2))-methyltransferase RsmD